MMGYSSLASYYDLSFNLTYRFNYSISEVENMIPFERDIYVEMILDDLKEKQERANRNGGS